MAKESVFSTPRTQTQTADQMLESMIQKRNAQRQNRSALAEAIKMQQRTDDFTVAMEATNAQTEQELQTTAAMERMAYETGTRSIAKQQLGIRQQMIQEGMEAVTGQVIGEIIYDSYWLDDPVKEATVEQIAESIANTWQYIEENCKDSYVAENKQSRLMQNIRYVIETTVKEATDRICKECEETDTAFPGFELTDAEEERMDEKLIDLGRDEIVDLIKSKVAAVVQDEKEKGQERAEMFDELDKVASDEGEQSGSTTEPIDGEGDQTPGSEEGEGAEEGTEDLAASEGATLAGVRSGEITLEGATWDTLKVIFSDNKKEAKAAYKNAARLAKSGRYNEAAKEYEKAKKIFQKMVSDVKSTDESVMSSVCSFLLSGWLEHAFIASIGGPGAGVSITKAICVTISAAFGMSIPFIIIQQIQTNEENFRKNRDSYSTNDYKVHAIAALNLNIEACDAMIKECKSKGRGKGTLEAALTPVTTDSGYTAGERHIAKLMESGAQVALFDDPTWGEFKSCVSMCTKRIRELLGKAEIGENCKECYCCAKSLIEELETKLSGVPETIPGDVKSFVMAMVNSIYGAVPADEIIISRFRNSMGTPDLSSSNPAVDYATVSWTDLFVNIKTNLSSIKSYCNNKCNAEVIDKSDLNNSDCPISGRNSLAQMIARNQSQIMAKNMGSSLFEAMMLGSIKSCSKIAMESTSNISDNDVEDAALIETLLHYTVFETLDTIGMYNFRMNDIKSAKRAYMNPITEAETALTSSTGSSDGKVLSVGKNRKGLKAVRINTSKLKKKSGSVMKSKLPTPDTSK